MVEKEVVNSSDFNFKQFKKEVGLADRGPGNPRTRNKRKYKNCICTFDIETSRVNAGTASEPDDQAVMYIWQWCFLINLNRYIVVTGRTWEEFKDFCAALSKTCNKNVYYMVFVHNLSYEFQFLRGIYTFNKDLTLTDLDKHSEVFCIESRKILKCEMYDFLEFRCSYLHSNMSLKVYTEKFGAPHAKLSGEAFDYNATRYYYTPLTPEQLQYCYNDVIGLAEAIYIEMTHDGDNLYTFPLTSTGYVRRDAKKAMRQLPHTFVNSILPDIKVYTLLREAFRGGNTHANRYYANILLTEDTVGTMHSADRSSSYPDTECNCDLPVSAFFYEPGEIPEDRFTKIVYERSRAAVFRIRMSNVKLKDPTWGAPYLSISKCRNKRGCIADNGRVLEAAYLETTVTDVDFKILVNEYSFNFEVFDLAHARYGKIPRPLIDCTIDYYKAKTELKNVAGQELFYMKQKNKLNSIYGMMAQDPVKHTIPFLDDEYCKDNKTDDELLSEHNKRAFLAYQWGVWITAWARYRLEEGIRIVHETPGAAFLYCDTDSIIYLGDVDFTEYNSARIKASKESGTFATDPAGITHYMGVFEPEDDMIAFKTLGAKKYCYIDKKKKELHLTLAGVGKKTGAKELEKAGGIKAFKEGFIFREAGGTESVYNDHPDCSFFVNEDNIAIPISTNVVIRDSTYTLGLTTDYKDILNGIKREPVDI